MFKRFLTLFLWVALGVPAVAQDLNVKVTVDRSQINSASLSFMDAFAGQVESYFNDHDWSEADSRNHERISTEIQIVLTGFDDNSTFRGTVVIRSLRPIYNTMRQTTLFLTRDDNWTFDYIPNRSLRHDEFQFDSIATLLDFYAFIILGYDFDSFYELGGSPWFAKAQNIVSVGQASSSAGWSRSGSSRRTRAQLVADLMNPGYETLRRAFYRYHRLGLDLFATNPEEARGQVIGSLEMIREARRSTTGTFLFDLFFNAKYLELVSLFEDASMQVRQEAYDILSEIDQGHLSAYEVLR